MIIDDVLALLGSIYGKITDVRNYFYDRGVFDSFGLGARTISIGNITAGGTGKTPLVAYVAELLSARGEKVCILTRGYGREDANKRVLVSDWEKILADARFAGDEPFELAHKLLGKAIVVADADRVSSAGWAKRKFGVTAFVLDDGFQHRRAKRDVDIVCIDATDPFGGGKMLPAGRLREAIANLKRADAVVITRSNLSDEVSNLRSQIAEVSGELAVFEAKSEIFDVRPAAEFAANGRTPSTLEPKETPAFAFCGIGNPESFFSLLRLENFSVIEAHAYRDHHQYTQHDVNEITEQARKDGASVLLTTIKDAVKLSNLKFEIPCFVVEIKLKINDAASFAAMI